MRDVSIETGIQLQDQFSGVIQGIMSSVSLAISAIYDMQQAMSMDVNMSSQETARENISQTGGPCRKQSTRAFGATASGRYISRMEHR